MKLRACILQNIIAPYRIPVFTVVAEHPELDLTVLYAAHTEHRRDWTVPSGMAFRYEVLKAPTVAARCAEVARRMSAERFDVVLSGGSITMPEAHAAALAARAAGSRVGFFWEGNFSRQVAGQGLRDAVKRVLLKQFHFMVVPSFASWDHLVALGTPSSHIHVAVNSVDHDRFQALGAAGRSVREQTRASMGLGNRVLLYVGRFSSEKRVDRIIRAFLSVAKQDWSLLLVGDGPDAPAVRAAAGTDPRVVFAGFREGEALGQCYGVADALVLASDHETWGLVVNEAMAAGLPCIVSDRVGAREMVIDGFTGRVVPQADPAALAGAIGELLGDPERSARMGRAAYKLCSTAYTPARQGEQMASALVKEARHAGGGHTA